MLKQCRHCERLADAPTLKRGLCRPCYRKPEVRRVYPRLAKRYDGQSQPLREPRPTTAQPGSPAKAVVLYRRWQDGERLWHPDDVRFPKWDHVQDNNAAKLHEIDQLIAASEPLAGNVA